MTPTALPGSVATAAGPDDDFQKVVLAEGTTLGEVMELTVAGDEHAANRVTHLTVDACGVADPSPAQHRWTIDRPAPRVKGLAGRSATIDSSPTIRARIIDRAAGVSRRGVRVVVDGRRVRGVRSRARVVTATSPSLTPGTHRVLLVARDRAGNMTRVRWRFAVRG